MTFEVLQNQITEILGQGNFEQDNKKFILSELRIPADWLYANKALYAQHYGMSQSAIYEWLQCGGNENTDNAHGLFYREILPLYVKKNPSSVSLLKALQHDKISESMRRVLIEDQELCVVDENLHQFIDALTARSEKITEWKMQTDVFKRFVGAIDRLKQIPTLTGSVGRDSVKQILQELVDIENLLNQKKGKADDIVNECLKRELLPIKAQLEARVEQFDSNNQTDNVELARRMAERIASSIAAG